MNLFEIFMNKGSFMKHTKLDKLDLVMLMRNNAKLNLS